LPRIFEPYFTTKKGSHGLGLATVYSIVTKHGGHIQATSTPGRGTTFTLWLPATESAAEPPVSEPPPPLPVAAGRPRVLIMDDEESIRTISATVLRRMGVDATVTADGDHALREFVAARAADRPFSLVILDLTIPGGMGGQQTIEAIRKMDPLVPAIVSSGYSSDPVMANYRDYGFQAVVAKPFDVTTLIQVVRRFIPEKTGA
jgi:two-component system, cell cycle sensor histidine kinase and response regulator CckA